MRVFAQRRPSGAAAVPACPRRQPGRDRGPHHPRLPRAGHGGRRRVLRCRRACRARRARRWAVRIGPAHADRELPADRRHRRRGPSRPGAEAVHPGYGFLAERAAFARAVEDAGIVFVGPSPATIDALGDKLQRGGTARAVGVAGRARHLRAGAGRSARTRSRRSSPRPRRSASRFWSRRPPAAGAAACAGSTRPEDLPAALAAGRAEAAGGVRRRRRSTWSGRSRPARHVEVQLLGDATGRRGRPRRARLLAPAAAPEARRGGAGTGPDRRTSAATLHAMAVRVATAAGLRNAATAEFLRDPDGAFYFLEVNTRLQVEHGVTELVSGLDIVREQFWLAAGAPLSTGPCAAADARADPSGHAIEVRHLRRGSRRATSRRRPAGSAAGSCRPGRASGSTPPSRPGTRVPPEYDNLIAKVMVHAARPGGGDRPPAAGPRRDGDRRDPDDPAVPPVRGAPRGLPRRPSCRPAGSRSTGTGRPSARGGRRAQLAAGLAAIGAAGAAAGR